MAPTSEANMHRARLLLPLSFILVAALLLSIGHARSSSSVLAASGTGCQGPLDCGPWPTLSHDNQRTNQSRYLMGPTTPTDVKVVYDSGTTPLVDIVVASDGKILLAACSPQINFVDASGTVNAVGYQQSTYRFPFGLAVNPPYSESATGFTVASDGSIHASIHECPDVVGSANVNYYSIAKNGTNVAGWPIANSSAMYQPPLVANSTIYQMDELAVVHAYALNGTVEWNVGFPGFSQGAIAADSAGNLYITTDGPTYGGHPAFSLSASGQSRTGWPQDLGGFPAPFTPAVSSQDVIYIVNSAGTLYAFNQDATSRAGFPFSTGGTVLDPPLAVGTSQTIYLQTSVGLLAINPEGSPNGALH